MTRSTGLPDASAARSCPVGPTVKVELQPALLRIIVDHAADDAAHGACGDHVDLGCAGGRRRHHAGGHHHCGAQTWTWDQAWPTSLDSMPGRMPSFCMARSYFSSMCGAEDQLGIGVAVQPAIVLQLVLELARRPAGIAERQDRAGRACAPRDRLEDVEGRGEADALVDRQGGVLDEEVGAVQHEAALGLDRAALQHGDFASLGRQLDLLGLGDHVELHQQVGEADVRGGLVDDDAHRALGRMRAHVDQAFRETLVLHAGRRNQHLPVEKAAGCGALLQRFACHSHGLRLLRIVCAGETNLVEAHRSVHEHVSGVWRLPQLDHGHDCNRAPRLSIGLPRRGKPRHGNARPRSRCDSVGRRFTVIRAAHCRASR